MAFKKNRQFCTGVGEPKNAWSSVRKPKLYDCYGVLEKSAWIWRIVGIFPISIKDSSGIRRYNVNKFHAVYSVLICCVCTCYCTWGMVQYTSWMSHMEVGHSMINITTWIRTVSSVLCMTVASIWRIFRHKEISEIIHTIVGQDVILKKMNCCLRYESNSKIICSYVWAMSATVVLLMAYDFYAWSRTFHSLSIHWLLWIIPLVAQVLDLTIFVSLVGLLGLKFRALNEKISTVATMANSSSLQIIASTDVCAENLRRIAKCHHSICAVCRRINRFFDIDVIINVITAFVILSSTLYYIFYEVERGAETSFVRIGTYIHWEFIHSLPIIIVVAICNWTYHQSINTGKLIHEIRVERTDSQMYEVVKSFSLQLHHQKIEFNAAGFFPLNSTLIQTMVGHITTYLVILIQFQPELE